MISVRLQQDLSHAKDASDVGQVFINFAPFFKGFAEYLANMHWAIKVEGHLRFNNRQFRDALIKCKVSACMSECMGE